MKANNDDSNYAGLDIAASDVRYDYKNFKNDNLTLINTSGTVQKRKINLKDSNEIYYATDDDGVILYAGEERLYQNGGASTKYKYPAVSISGTQYWTENPVH